MIKVEVSKLQISQYIDAFEQKYLTPLMDRIEKSKEYYEKTKAIPTDKEKELLESLLTQIKDLNDFINQTQKIILSHCMMVACVDSVVDAMERINDKPEDIQAIHSKLKMVNSVYGQKEKIDKFGKLIGSLNLKLFSINEINNT